MGQYLSQKSLLLFAKSNQIKHYLNFKTYILRVIINQQNI